MNCSQLLEEAAQRLDAGGVSTPRLDSQVLLAHCIGRDRQFLYAHPEYDLANTEGERFRAMVARRMSGEPVAYITGEKEFWSLTFEVNPNVLIPRPDTEILVEEVLRRCREEGKPCVRLLEIGTGSGAISVAIASELEQAAITATDSCPEALAIAEKNALNNQVAERISFIWGDLFGPAEGIYDIVVSNPPYISEREFDLLPPEVREHEPRRALVAGADGTEFHRRIVRDANRFLEKGGWLAMELGVGQRGALEKMLHENEYYDIVFHRDYAGIERVVLARTRGRTGG
jgi:release factor glutamine methyltransferase